MIVFRNKKINLTFKIKWYIIISLYFLKYIKMKKYILLTLIVLLTSCSNDVKKIENNTLSNSWINNIFDEKIISNSITKNSTYDKILDIYDKNYDSIINGNYNYVEWEKSIENGSYINLRSNYNYNCDNEEWICILDKISPFDNIPRKISININTGEFKILEKSRVEENEELLEKTSNIENRLYQLELKTYSKEISTALKIARNKLSKDYNLDWMEFYSYGIRNDYWEYVEFKKEWMYWAMEVNLTKKEVEFIH